MNYKLLLEGLTFREFENLLENWYSRLNRIKEKYMKVHHTLLYDIDNDKARKIAVELTERLLVLTNVFNTIIANHTQPTYSKGS